MTSVGVMASSVVTAVCTDVLSEPFNNLTAWTTTGLWNIVAGRTGTAASAAGSTARLTHVPAVEDATLTAGFAWRTTGLSATNNVARFLSDTQVTTHNLLYVTSAGAIGVQRLPSTPLGASATGLITINTWYYIEARIFLHDTAGTVQVRVNGTEVLNLTAQDTRNAGTKTVFDGFQLTGPLSSTTATYDDLYLSAGAGCGFKGSITIP